MKKSLQISAFILFLSFAAFSQDGDRGKGSPWNDATLNLIGNQQQLEDDLMNMTAFMPHSGRNEDFLLIWRYKMTWHYNKSIWIHDRKVFYSYDEFDNLAESFESWTNGSSPYGKTIYFYDVNHNLDEERVYLYNGSEWENSYKYLYNYDGNSNLVQRTRQTWNNDMFENEVKDTYAYNASNQKIYQTSYYWVDDAWEESQIFSFLYDVNNNLSLVQSQAWIDDELVNWQKSSYYWDTTGNLQSIVSSKWDSEEFVWLHPHHSQNYMYDIDNNRIIFVTQHYSEDLESWINDFKSTYYYQPKESETVEYKSSGINKPIDDFQTTEDDIVVQSAKANKPLIGVEVVIDTVLHTSVGDLEFTLSHNGVNQKIINRVGGDGDNFTGTLLSDYGVDTLANGIAPFYGIYKPGNPLSSFVGTDPSGKWTLSIYDGTAGNTGTLDSWGLKLIYGSGGSSFDEPDGNASLEIFPNPTQGKLQIKSSLNSIHISTIEIIDLYGEKVMDLSPAPGTRHPELNISHFPTGIFFVRLYVDHQMIMKKIIKL